MRAAALAWALCAALLSACVSAGTRFNPKAVRELQPGISTESDAIAKLGQPSAESDMGLGKQLLQWQYVYGNVFGGGGAHAAILFGPDGKMIKVAFFSQQ